MDNTDISTSSKGKTPASINNVETYNKETLNDKICKLTAINIQLMIDKIKTEKTRINLEANKVQLFDKKNFLVAKRKKLRTEIVILNAAGHFNVLIRSYQDPLLKLTQDKFKAKRLPSFDSLKKNF